MTESKRKVGRPAVEMGGRRFGRWVVIAQGGKDPRGHLTYLCRCDCGNTATLSGGDLRRGDSESCGCLKNILSSNRHFKDLTGRIFDRLTVTGWAAISKRGAVFYCKCECGTELTVPGTYLVRGGTRSCGCLRADSNRRRVPKNFKSRAA